MDKNMTANQQMLLLEENRLDKLKAYAQTHDLDRAVTVKLIAELERWRAFQNGASIH